MGFETAREQHFPGAMPQFDFVGRSQSVLYRHRLSRDTALPCIAVCRDELTAPLVAQVRSAWGEPFGMAGLAGMLLLGRTGFQAALSHAPSVGGRSRVVFFALPHIAIDRGGEVGRHHRRGQPEPTSACGALAAVIGTLAEEGAPSLNDALDVDDVELDLVRRRLLAHWPPGQAPDLVALTRLAHEVLVEDLERLIAQTVEPAACDYAVLSGIQVHGPAGRHYVWPGRLYAVVEGERHDLGWSDVS